MPFAREAVEVAPTSVVASTNLSACLLGVGDVIVARAEVGEALRWEPGDATARYILELVEEAERLSGRSRIEFAVVN